MIKILTTIINAIKDFFSRIIDKEAQRVNEFNGNIFEEEGGARDCSEDDSNIF